MKYIEYILSAFAVLLFLLILYRVYIVDYNMKNVEMKYSCYHSGETSIFIFYDDSFNPEYQFNCQATTIGLIRDCVLKTKMEYRRFERVNFIIKPDTTNRCRL